MSENSKIEPMGDERLAEIEARAKRASTGPWKTATGKDFGENWPITTGNSSIDGEDYHVCTDNICASRLYGDAKTDAEFIAHARTDIPDLVAEIKRLRGAVQG